MNTYSEPDFRLLRYQSKTSRGAGMEVIIDSSDDLRAVVNGLKRLGELAQSSHAPDFIVLDLLKHHTAEELRIVASCTAAHGLAGKLCVVLPLRLRPSVTSLSQLQDHGIRVLLGGVGADARFADLTDFPIDGLVVDRSLISRATGDPQAASVLEAIATLATNLGLKTFAHRCLEQIDVDVALSCGVHYLTLENRLPAGMPVGTSSPSVNEERATHG
jgi:hypothetical protein